MSGDKQETSEKMPLPGTPEYDEMYAAAASKLDNAIAKGEDINQVNLESDDDSGEQDDDLDSDDTSGSESDDGSDDDSDSQDDQDDQGNEDQDDESDYKKKFEEQSAQLETLTRELESTKKSGKDTKAWATKMAQELKALKAEIKQSKEEDNRPEALDDLEGLEEAIDYKLNKLNSDADEDDDDLLPPGDQDDDGEEPDPQQVWMTTVNEALPDLNEQLNDPEFLATVTAKAEELGDEWSKPLVAIRELNILQRDYLVKKHTAELEAQHIKRSKKKEGMKVPGGKGGETNTRKKVDLTQDADAVRNLSDEDFEAKKQEILGYN